MDLMAAIGLLSSIVTLEEAGRSWVLIVKDKVKRKKIDINNWDSNDPLVQSSLDRFKTDMGDKYKDHIFSEEEIQEIIRGFFEQKWDDYWGDGEGGEKSYWLVADKTTVELINATELFVLLQVASFGCRY